MAWFEDQEIWEAMFYLAGYDKDDAQCRDFHNTLHDAEEYAKANGDLNVYTVKVMVDAGSVREWK